MSEKIYRVRISAFSSPGRPPFLRVAVGTEEEPYQHEFEAPSHQALIRQLCAIFDKNSELISRILPWEGPKIGTDAFQVLVYTP